MLLVISCYDAVYKAFISLIKTLRKNRQLEIGFRISWLTVDVKFSVCIAF